MPTYEVAHIKEQGVDLIIIPLDSSFGRMTERDQNGALMELQARATAAGLAGTAVPVWDAGFGHMGFKAPQSWRSLFQNLTLASVRAKINKQISW